MTRILVLGATGRTGNAIITALPTGIQVTAALRTPADASRLPATAATIDHAVVNLASTDSIQQAMERAQVVVNAIRFREDIAPTELITVHERLRAAGKDAQNGGPRIVTVGGAGTLHLPGGRRFWQSPSFPRRTLPRGRAHAMLRDHLEAGNAGDAWAYLIPPPAYYPAGPATGRWEQFAPATDETAFTHRAISYADFGAALAHTAIGTDTGTQLIAWP